MPRKIFELNKDTWGAGIAPFPTSLKGGLWRTAPNFDPLEVPGYMQPARVSVRYGNAQVTKEIQYFANFTKSNAPYTYGYGSNSGGVTHLYEIDTAGAVTDVSAQIATTASARGLINWKDNVSSTRGLIYATDTTIRANSLLVALANDLEILTGLVSAEHKFEPGADGNLYFTNGNMIGRITSTTGTGGNSTSVFTFPKGFTIRDIANDGRYLVIVADDNTGTDNLGSYNVIIGYWNYASPDFLTQRYNLVLNNGVVAVQIMDGNAHVFSRDGMFVCNVNSFPQLKFPFSGTSNLAGAFPTLSSQVTKRGASVILWADGNSTKVYGYGSQGMGDAPVMFQPTSIASGTITALCVQGKSSTVTNILIANDTPALYIQGISTTREECLMRSSNITLPQTYKLDHIKIVTQNVLASGEGVTVKLLSQSGSGLVTNTLGMDFATNGARQSIVLDPYQPNVPVFNEFDITIDAIKVCVQSVEVWGEPQDVNDQTV